MKLSTNMERKKLKLIRICAEGLWTCMIAVLKHVKVLPVLRVLWEGLQVYLS